MSRKRSRRRSRARRDLFMPSPRVGRPSGHIDESSRLLWPSAPDLPLGPRPLRLPPLTAATVSATRPVTSSARGITIVATTSGSGGCHVANSTAHHTSGHRTTTRPAERKTATDPFMLTPRPSADKARGFRSHAGCASPRRVSWPYQSLSATLALAPPPRRIAAPRSVDPSQSPWPAQSRIERR